MALRVAAGITLCNILCLPGIQYTPGKNKNWMTGRLKTAIRMYKSYLAIVMVVVHERKNDRASPLVPRGRFVFYFKSFFLCHLRVGTVDVAYSTTVFFHTPRSNGGSGIILCLEWLHYCCICISFDTTEEIKTRRQTNNRSYTWKRR